MNTLHKLGATSAKFHSLFAYDAQGDRRTFSVSGPALPDDVRDPALGSNTFQRNVLDPSAGPRPQDIFVLGVLVF